MIGKAAFILIAALLATPALALESAPVSSSRVTATLISDTDAVSPGVPLQLALRLRISPGWHTYWSNPGDAGAAPELTLTLPGGAGATGIVWPTPTRMPEGPLMTYGYTGEVVLPVTVTPAEGALTVQASATWLVCERICVPEEGSFTLQVPQGTPSASAQAPLFRSAAARSPRPSPFEAHVAPDGTLTVTGAELSRAAVTGAWFFPSQPDVIDQASPQPIETGAGFVSLRLKPGRAFKPDLPLEGVLVLKDQADQESSLSVAAGPGGPAVVSAPLWKTLALALAGGLLLNLMPCVFPVLAMKAVAMARLSGQARSHVQAQAASYTAGVLAAFAGIGALLVGVRQAGGLVGWGFQFQSPVFVATTALVLFAVGLNLSGVFHVGSRFAGAGQGLGNRQGYAGSFFTGLLAVLVATPCTAPFMGAAVAAALVAPPATTISIFLVMGLGLAAPYAALSLVPGLSRLLPRPSGWMDVVKSALAFPMYGAAVWLAWVVSLQAGPDGVLATASGFVLVGLAAWSAGLAQGSGKRWLYAVALAPLLLSAVLVASVEASGPTGSVSRAGIEPFSQTRLAALRDGGQPVFVNMTAAWCVTCLVNERVALSSVAVKQAFASHHVIYLKGDWTRSDPGITAFLQSHARDGVPLYVLYPGGGAAPLVLPQILTEAEVLMQLDRLGS